VVSLRIESDGESGVYTLFANDRYIGMVVGKILHSYTYSSLRNLVSFRNAFVVLHPDDISELPEEVVLDAKN